ncbi:hypothetical protein IFR08_10170 [Pseudomonas fluorescens]|uniref:condensation domain-containing protein n=1 Tax=Pseudomonas fluorescens TaxID=294 RepID=UPI00177CA5C1|nr:condensation domain-containing protein [Pseudomonas fluorescens]MBD8099216.1 hypothetical protein [Pseudomonas fluorescens]MBD8774135.1 hypothetical protein [Pseudomonas fluorescens]MBD8780835.1 hypothetical protein [Pseudomonas fluorescens]MBD8796712.1 hypothetical protein [Pseudomonas fluorescens]
MDSIESEARLKHLLKCMTGRDDIDPRTLIADVSDGVTSLNGYASALAMTFGTAHPFAMLQRCASVGDLMEALRAENDGMPCVSTHPELAMFTPANRYSYFFKRERQLQAWTVCSPLWLLDGPLDREAMTRAVRAVFDRHEGLRLQGRMTALGWCETIKADLDELPITWLDSDLPDEEQAHAQIEDVLQRVVASLQFSGPLVRVLAGGMQSQRGVMCVIAHHLIVDDISFRLVNDELLDLYQAHKNHQAPVLEPVSMTLSVYSARCIDYWNARAEQQLQWWQRQPWEQTSRLFPSTSADPQHVQERYSESSRSSIFIENQEQFFFALSQQGVTPAQLVLAAAGYALCDWFGVPFINLGLVTHGRESIAGADTRRTVGWLSEVVPVILPASARGDSAINGRHTLFNLLRSGKSYGILREIGADLSVRNRMRELPLPEISLNIKLQPNSSCSLSGVQKSRRTFDTARFTQEATRVYSMSGGVFFNANRLVFSWDYSRGRVSQASGNELCGLFAGWFRRLASQWAGLELPMEISG